MNEVTRKKQAMLCEITTMKKFDIRKNMDKLPVFRYPTGIEADRLSTTFLASDARAWHYLSSPLYHKSMDRRHLDAQLGPTFLPCLMHQRDHSRQSLSSTAGR